MSESIEKPENQGQDEWKVKQEQQAKELKTLYENYRGRNWQTQSYEDYLKKKREAHLRKQKRFRIPDPLKFVLSTPFLVVFCFGIFFIPMLLFQIFTAFHSETSHSASDKTEKKVSKKYDSN